MTQARTKGRDLQEEILSTVRRSQSAVVKVIGTWSARVQSVRPPLSARNLPFTSRLPAPQELIASAYDFAEQLLASQRKFAEDVLKAMAPLTAADGEAAAKKNGTAPAKTSGTAAK